MRAHFPTASASDRPGPQTCSSSGTQAGGAGFSDEDYAARGATVVATADGVFDIAELIVKVKEPQAVERARLRPDHTLFTYLHLAADPKQASELLASGVTAIAYESVTDSGGRLPLLAPMSQVAGRMSIQAGAHCLEGAAGGRGVLLGGVPGVPAAPVVVLGGGVVGTNAIETALGLGANVTVLDRNPVPGAIGRTIRPVVDDPLLQPGRFRAGHHRRRPDRRGGAAARRAGPPADHRADGQGDAARFGARGRGDRPGGCAATSHPTTHADPTFTTEGVVHYCVANMPGAVPRPPRWRSTTPPSPTCCGSPRTARWRRCAPMPACATVSTCTGARSANPPSPSPWASPTPPRRSA